MHPNTAPDHGQTENHETWVSGLATAISFCLIIIFAVAIANTCISYAEAKIDSFAHGPAWLKKW